MTRGKFIKRRSAVQQARQLATLNKKVTTLTKNIYKPTQFQVGGSTDVQGIHEPEFDLDSYGGRPLVYPLLCPALSLGANPISHGWKAIFETSQNSSGVQNEDNQYQYNLSGIHSRFLMEVEATNRTQPNWYQIFIVSIKRNMRRQTLAMTNQLAQLRDGLDYVMSTTGTLEANCLWRLNTSVFDIHYSTGPKIIGVYPFFGAQPSSDTPEFITPGNHVTNISDVTKTHSKYIKWRKKLIARPEDSGATITGFMDLPASQIADSSQLYVIAFTNAQGGVTGNRLSYSANHTIYGSTVV
jgi:hypothetical protein